MKFLKKEETLIKSGVCVDWLEMTFFYTVPDILKGRKGDAIEALREFFVRPDDKDLAEYERLLQKFRPETWEQENNIYQSHNYTAETVAALMGEYGADLERQKTGALGYRRRDVSRYGVVILSEGLPEMGVHVSLTGAVCGLVDDMQGLIRLFMENGAKPSRVDLAIDDCEGALPLRAMVEKCRAGECSSRSKTFLVMEGGYIKDGSPTGLTLYIGKKGSDFMTRIYDKRLESIHEHGKRAADLPAHWIRAEMECRGAAALNLCGELSGAAYWSKKKLEIIEDQQPADMAATAAAVINNYLEFKDRGTDSNKSRWPVSGFWQRFIDGAGKLSISRGITKPDIDRRAKWFAKQCAATVAILLKTDHADRMQTAVIHAGYNLNMQQREEINKHNRRIKAEKEAKAAEEKAAKQRKNNEKPAEWQN